MKVVSSGRDHVSTAPSRQVRTSPTA